MTEQKKCEKCDFWRKEVEWGHGSTPAGGEFKKPEQKSGVCEKHNEVKSAHDSCEDWESQK